MTVLSNPGFRAAATGVAAAALLVGAFALGTSRGGSGPAAAAAQAATTNRATTDAATSGAARITVTGTGTVTGTPNQLILAMGVQASGGTVNSALTEANQATRRVTATLRSHGVPVADIQTSGLSIQPNYNNSQVVTGYGVSESLTATLNQIGQAGSQIQAAVQAGGNAVTVDDVSLNLADNSSLLAAARTNAVRDARARAVQYAKALGEPLGQVISISDDGSPQPVSPNAFATASAGSVPISPGRQQLSVSVTVVFAA
jgi:uncharacterized protein YggE